jgi:hypothetical protein
MLISLPPTSACEWWGGVGGGEMKKLKELRLGKKAILTDPPHGFAGGGKSKSHPRRATVGARIVAAFQRAVAAQ